MAEQKLNDDKVNISKPFGGMCDGYYLIKNVNSGLYVDVPGGSKATSVQLQQWPLNKSAAQIYYIKHLSNGIYTIQNKGSGLYFDISGASKDNGAQLIQFTLNNTPYGTSNQHFRFVEDGSGSYYIFNVKSGQVLDIPNGSKDAKAKIQQWPPNGSGAQRFKLQMM